MNNTIERLADGTLVFLPERLNRDPAVLHGLTNDEMWVALGAGAVIGLLLGVPLAIATASIAVAPTGMIAGMALVLLAGRSEEHTSELQSLMRISYAVFCLKKKNKNIVILNLLEYDNNTANNRHTRVDSHLLYNKYH